MLRMPPGKLKQHGPGGAPEMMKMATLSAPGIGDSRWCAPHGKPCYFRDKACPTSFGAYEKRRISLALG